MDLSGKLITQNSFFAKNRIDFKVMRNNQFLEQTVTGFFSKSNKIQISKPANIKSGDWLVSNNEKYFITSLSQTPNFYILKYQSEYEHQQTSAQTINIQSINGNAIVGNQQNATFNINCNFQDARNLIAEKPLQDQEQLNKLIDRVESAINENQPISKGSLAYYADILNKYSDVAQIVGNLLVKWTAF